MYVKQEAVLERVRGWGFAPLANTVICARLAPYGEKTLVDRGVEMFKDSMKFSTPESFFSVLVCTENELVVIPLSWWTGNMKKDEYRTIAYADITAFNAPEAKAISWRGRLTTKQADYEMVLSDEKLASLKLAGGALLEGEWQKNNLPSFVEKLNTVV